MKIKIIIAVICLFTLNTFGQNAICECCTYSSLQYKENFEDIFNPEIIKSNNIKELTVFITSKEILNTKKDTTYKIVNKEYREMILKFNKSGYVTEHILFTQLGSYNAVREYKRDNQNKIITKTSYYLDSLGKKDEFIDERWTYTYLNGRLKQKKEVGNTQKVQPDSKSSFENYEYDINGRIVKNTRNTPLEGSEAIYYQTITTYNDVAKSSTAITKNAKSVFSVTNTQYNSNQKPLNIKFREGKNNKILEQENYIYNIKGQLLKFNVKNLGLATECPDSGDYSDQYFYSALNLIDKIKHSYNKTICELRFEYK